MMNWYVDAIIMSFDKHLFENLHMFEVLGYVQIDNDT